MVIEWRALLISVVITFAIGAALAVAWGIGGLMVFATFGDDAKSFYESSLASVCGWLISLVPVAIGTIYLVKSIDRNYITHCLLFVGIQIAISFALSLAFPDDDASWSEFVFYLAIFPVTLVTCAVARRSS